MRSKLLVLYLPAYWLLNHYLSASVWNPFIGLIYLSITNSCRQLNPSYVEALTHPSIHENHASVMKQGKFDSALREMLEIKLSHTDVQKIFTDKLRTGGLGSTNVKYKMSSSMNSLTMIFHFQCPCSFGILSPCMC